MNWNFFTPDKSELDAEVYNAGVILLIVSGVGLIVGGIGMLIVGGIGIWWLARIVIGG